MIYISAAVALLLLFMGWGIYKKKWYFLISGYNLMSKEQKAQVDIEPLAKLLAIMTTIIAATLILMGISAELEMWTMFYICLALLIITPFGLIFYSRKYYRNVDSALGTGRANKIGGIITIATLVFVGIIFYFSSQDTEFTVSDEGFDISGMYGDTYEWSSIENLEISDSLPAIAIRTNGSAVGSKLKGHFKFKNGDKATLFLDKQIPAFIQFTVENKLIILNSGSVEETQALFEQLNEKVSH